MCLYGHLADNALRSTGSASVNQRQTIKKADEDVNFENCLEWFGLILLDKSLTPPAKIKKEEPGRKFSEQLQILLGIDMKPEQVKKEVHNCFDSIGRKVVGFVRRHSKHFQNIFLDLQFSYKFTILFVHRWCVC